MDVNDPRVKRTQKLLMEALVQLSLAKGYDVVTIRDITEQADIAYSTFFRHYPDKSALLRAMVSESVNTLRALIQELPEDSPDAVGKLLFDHIEKHEALFRVIFSSTGIHKVLQEVQEDVQQELMQSYAVYQHPDADIPFEVAVYLMTTAIFALVKWWLEHSKPYSIERMARIYSELIIKPTENAAFQATVLGGPAKAKSSKAKSGKA